MQVYAQLVSCAPDQTVYNQDLLIVYTGICTGDSNGAGSYAATPYSSLQGCLEEDRRTKSPFQPKRYHDRFWKCWAEGPGNDLP